MERQAEGTSSDRGPGQRVTALPSHEPSPPAGQRGFALLTVLLTLIGVTALAAAGFLLTDSDYRAGQNDRASIDAFHTANAGLYQFLGTQSDTGAAQTYSVAAGQVAVGVEQLLTLGDGRSLHRVLAQATYEPPEGGTAHRTVSTLVLLSDGSVPARAAIAAVSGIEKNGGSGTISGDDSSGGGDCEGSPALPVAGVLVPPGGYEQTGGSPVPEGDPDILELAEDELIDYLSLGWQDIVDGTGGVLYPDYLLPPDAWPSLGGDQWPVVLVDGSMAVDPSHSGQGTLVVKQDLTMNGSFRWEGMILVGGVMTSNGKNQIEGVVIAGLNELLGDDVDASHIAHGNKTFQYNSCSFRRAARHAFGGFYEVPGTWRESM